MLKVYIGWDQRESQVASVAVKTLANSSGITAEFISRQRLRDIGLLNRPTDLRGHKFWDFTSNAAASTEFAISRFMTPILCQNGWALFTDCDVVFMRDVHELLKLADSKYAVMVVKHNQSAKELSKMDGQPQTAYAKKNWSSVALYNCDHPANRRLTVHDVNNRAGIDLHQFYWLHESEIGELPMEWNWLVGEQEKPVNPAIAHFTLGGPWCHDWTPKEHDDIWLEAAK